MTKISKEKRLQRTRIWTRSPAVNRAYFPLEVLREGVMGLQNVCSICNRYPDEGLSFVDPGPGAVCLNCYVHGT